jgi:hypothetical protein
MAQPERLCVPNIGDEHTICVPHPALCPLLMTKSGKITIKSRKNNEMGHTPSTSS